MIGRGMCIIAVSFLSCAMAGAHDRESNGVFLDTRAFPETCSNGVMLDTRTLFGDVNGDDRVSVADFLLLQQYVNDLREEGDPLVPHAASADLNGDSLVDAGDVALLGDLLSEFNAELRSVDTGMVIADIQPATAGIGSPLRLRVEGVAAESIVSVRIGQADAPIIHAQGNKLVVATPYLPPGQADVFVATRQAVSLPGTVAILPLPAATMAREEVKDTLAGVITGITGRLENQFRGNRTLEPATAEALGGLMESLAGAATLIEQRVDALAPEELRLLEGLLANAELLELFREMGFVPAQRGLLDYSMAELYLELDATSFILGNVGNVLGPVTIIAWLIPGGQPVAAILHIVSNVMGWATFVIDILPTDLQTLTVVLPEGEMTVGTPVPVSITGDFKAQNNAISAALEKLLSIFGGKGLNSVVGQASKGLEDLQEEVTGFIAEKVAGPLTVAAWEDFLDRLSWQHNDVPVNPTVYQVTILDLASLAIPNVSLAALETFLEWVGIHDFGTIVNPVHIVPAEIADMRPLSSSELSPLQFGEGVFTLSGIRFEEWGLGFLRWRVVSASVDFRVAGRGVLSVQANIPEAGWEIIGDGVYYTIGSGTGRVYADLPAGAYSIRWYQTPGYIAPVADIGYLDDGGRLVFNGVYEQSAGTIVVEPSISAGWEITGPAQFSGNGVHSQIRDCPPGNYTIRWQTPLGYNPVPEQTLTLAPDGLLTFSAAFIPQVAGRVVCSVRDALSRDLLAGVSFSFADSAGRFLGTGTTGNAGQCSVSLPPGDAVVMIAKGGYVSTTARVAVTAEDTVRLDTVLFALDRDGPGIIRGKVVNALTGQGVSGATIRLYSGVGLTGTPVSTSGSDSSGNYEFSVSGGTYTASATASGFVAGTSVVAAVGGETLSSQNIPLSPRLPSGETRIVLTWGATPSDLDSHLTGPTTSGARFHVFYAQKTGGGSTLDVDDVSSYGPETITISQRSPGTYRYSVHDYTNLGDSASRILSDSSEAMVRVFQSTGEVARFWPPAGRTGNLWTVFEMDGATGSISEVGSLSSQSSPGSVTRGGAEDIPWDSLPEKTDASPLVRSDTGKPDNSLTSPVLSSLPQAPLTAPGLDVWLLVSVDAQDVPLSAAKCVLRYDPEALQIQAFAVDDGVRLGIAHAGGNPDAGSGRAVIVLSRGDSLAGATGPVGLFAVRVRGERAGVHSLDLIPVEFCRPDGTPVNLETIGLSVACDPAADSDNDGLLDSFELATFGDLTLQTAEDDYDGDGETNAAEYTGRSDAANAASATDPANRYTDYSVSLYRRKASLDPNLRGGIASPVQYGIEIHCTPPDWLQAQGDSAGILADASGRQIAETTVAAEGGIVASATVIGDETALRIPGGRYTVALSPPGSLRSSQNLRFAADIPETTEEDFPPYVTILSPVFGAEFEGSPQFETDSQDWDLLTFREFHSGNIVASIEGPGPVAVGGHVSRGTVYRAEVTRRLPGASFFDSSGQPSAATGSYRQINAPAAQLETRTYVDYAIWQGTVLYPGWNLVSGTVAEQAPQVGEPPPPEPVSFSAQFRDRTASPGWAWRAKAAAYVQHAPDTALATDGGAWVRADMPGMIPFIDVEQAGALPPADGQWHIFSPRNGVDSERFWTATPQAVWAWDSRGQAFSRLPPGAVLDPDKAYFVLP